MKIDRSPAHKKYPRLLKPICVAINQIQECQKKLRDQVARTHQLYLDGSITSQGFGQFYKPAEERLNQLPTELPKPRASGTGDQLKINDISAEDVLQEAETLYSRWPKLSVENK